MKRAGTRCVPALFYGLELGRVLQTLPPLCRGLICEPGMEAGRRPPTKDARREGTSGKRQGLMRHQARTGCLCGEQLCSCRCPKRLVSRMTALSYCFLMVSVEPMDALMMAERAAHWARLSCSPRKRNPERAASAGSRLMRMLNVREGRFFSAMISTP